MTKEECVDILLLILPGPLGRAMRQPEAAKSCGVSLRTFQRKFSELREQYPEAYEYYKSAWRETEKRRESLERVKYISYFLDNLPSDRNYKTNG